VSTAALSPLLSTLCTGLKHGKEPPVRARHGTVYVENFLDVIHTGYSEFKFHQVLPRVAAGRLVKVIYHKGVMQITEGA
jgi:hypothetical protein